MLTVALPAEARARAAQPDVRSAPPVVLVAEDDAAMRTLLARVLRTAGYTVLECRDGWELLDIMDASLPNDEHPHVDLVITDNRMPGITGLDLLALGQVTRDFPPTILITAFGDMDTHAEARASGAVCVFDKPFDLDRLLERVKIVVPL
jgi:two-component system, response regulator, stage 0 sporulation protein F